MESLKLVMLGDGAVGKSALLIVYTTHSFPSNYIPTVFDNYSTDVIVGGKQYSLGLFDTAGQEDYDRLRPLCYPGTDIFVLCFSVESRASFANIASKWIPEIRHHMPDTPILLVATKTDLRGSSSSSSCITFDEGFKLAQKLNIDYTETSALSNSNVTGCFEKAVYLAVSNQSKKGVLGLGKRKGKNRIPLPPEMPPAGKAPWIEIQTSTLGADLGKALEKPSNSDVTFVVEEKDIFAHKLVLCSACNFFCRVFGLKTPDQDIASSTKVWNFTWEDINEGKITGLTGIHDTVLRDSHDPNEKKLTRVTVSADISYKTFKSVLAFLYTGLPNITEDASEDDLLALSKASDIFHLPHLKDIIKNLQNEEEFLNPSIGTYLNDQTGERAKWLFLNRETLSDVRFRVEDTTVYAHKVILTSRCDFMARMFSGVFTESSQNQITIEDTSLECFLALLEYFYTDHSPIEEGDAVGILVAADRYGQERLKNLCELYITKGVDVAVANCIAEAHVDVIGLLLTAQLYNSRQLAAWCLHFIASNFIAFQQRSEFKTLEGDNLNYVNEQRWPPVSYLEAVEEHQAKYSEKNKGKDNKCKVQ